MNLQTLLRFSADYMGPGAALTSVVRQKKLEADASPSDLASHHLYEEPSSTDDTIRRWRSKRVQEKALRRNKDPFELGAQSRPVTGPCGCTLQLGDQVVVEGVGRGEILKRRGRMLAVRLRNGNMRHVDQKFVHQLKSV